MPLMVRGGKGREQGRDPKSTGGDEEAAPYLAQVCSMFQALSSLSRGAAHPGVATAREDTKPCPGVSSAKSLSLFLLPSSSWRRRRTEICSLLFGERERTDRAPAAPSANGAPGTRQGLFSGGGWTLLLRPSPGRGRTRSQAETRLAGTS